MLWILGLPRANELMGASSLKLTIMGIASISPTSTRPKTQPPQGSSETSTHTQHWVSFIGLRIGGWARIMERVSPDRGHNILSPTGLRLAPTHSLPLTSFSFLSSPAYDYDKFPSLSHAEQINNNFSSLNILLGFTLHPKWLANVFLHPNIFRAVFEKNSGE